MPAPTPAPARSLRRFWPVAVPVVIGLAYACGHLGWYLGTPLGRVPVLDERENLTLAETIFRGALPAEPFYRASGYALILAVFRVLGVSANGLFSVALVFGAVLHAVNAGLVAALARRWFGATAALIAGLLCALHPVFVHYATQALDAVPALTLFLSGLVMLAPALAREPAESRGLRWASVSLCWAAATLLRPNYLLVWLTLPILAWWSSRSRLGSSQTHSSVTHSVTLPRCAAAFAGVILFVAMAGWQHHVSGHAGFMPWQGAYNLWAANEPGSNGRYYTQHVSLSASLAETNPTRAESVLRYQQETGLTSADIAAMNAHWRAKFLDHVFHHPIAWLGQLAHKTYALLNDWEQYNNKTFAFHQARSPWLRWNPLSWGVIFVFGVAGAYRLSVDFPRVARSLALITLACAASALLFFVSARFRLPLAALAAVLAGGALASPTFWRDWTPSRRLGLGIAAILAAMITFSSFDQVRSRATFVQDHALLARAAASVGDDALAWREASAALELQPGHPDALRLAIASYFNQLLQDTARPADETRWRQDCMTWLSTTPHDAPDLVAVAVLSLWRSGQTEPALRVWRELGTTPSALAARLLVRDASASRGDFAALPRSAWDQPLVRLAAVSLDIPPPVGVMLDSPARAAAEVKRLFNPTP